MKIPILVAAFGILTAAQLVAADSPPFPAADLMRIGVYYYPEAWPSNQWARDIANIKKMNLEFATWASLRGRSWSRRKAALISTGSTATSSSAPNKD